MLWIRIVNAFTKITGFLPQLFCFRTKIYYEDKKAQGRRIKGPAIIISNHTSVYDYAVILFVFFWRTLRYQMAELLFRKRLLRNFLKSMGGIFVDRDAHNFSFVGKSEEILKRGGVVGIFPESRLPREGEPRPLEFKPSAAYLALSSGVPIIPVYTNGSYFKRARARVIIGKPVYAADLASPDKTDKENVAAVTKALRDRIILLRETLDGRTKEKKG
ncbi:MAG: 1-acyl-sn-glycerol-3-phosphate acyltransferase [Clostridia bacterium]|nr:1-acyl-sn-glycerol-3-phosphate acyltransferase [Clostridia bacterium]